VIRSALRYHQPESRAEASSLLAEHAGDVAVLAGGTQLLPRMFRGEVTVGHIVDLKRLDIATIRVSDDGVEIGAGVTYAQVVATEALITAVPLLPRMARGVTGGRQITQQGTLVGSLCLNTPGSEMPGVAVSLDGRVRIAGVGVTRELDARQFLTGPESVALGPGEFVTSLVLRRTAIAGYYKLKHAAGSWPIATASAVFDAQGAGVVTLGAVQGTPVQVTFGDDIQAIPELVEATVTAPWDDVLAPARYRAAVAKVVAVRAARQLMEASHGY
jgi:aerobic carbon-monoxide dehydrogenase medium subunit